MARCQAWIYRSLGFSLQPPPQGFALDSIVEVYITRLMHARCLFFFLAYLDESALAKARLSLVVKLFPSPLIWN